MRRGLVHALAWSLATGAAVTLSWWGVHTVMAGTAYDPPLALPIPAANSGSPSAGDPSPVASSTTRPRTQPPTRKPTPKKPRPTPTPTKPQPTPEGEVKSYTLDGGRVVFALGDTSAELVSAIPSAGWQMQVWKQPTWIRVTFTRDARELSVFAVWHDSAPRVELDER
ncbi:hypothetical protein ABZO31_11865 [Streptomyces sp. HUAS MG47]|uniref:hypothetical protein n=1 Tax=Streptomyces solicamelliae TaxID=3231716 RepID=UPI0038784304